MALSYNSRYSSPQAEAMPPTTDTELKELKDLVIGLREEMRVGFAQVDTKFAQMEAKMNAQFTEVKGDIKVVDQRVVALDDKMTGLDDRLKAQDAKFWTLVTIIIGSLAATVSTFVIRYVLPAIPIK
jgi:hypothetical protein